MINLKIFLTFALVTAIVSGSSGSDPDDEGKKIDDQVEKALDFYKFTVMMDSFKSLDEDLHKVGVNLDAVVGSNASSRPEFLDVLLTQILKGKRSSEIKEWANREAPNLHYIGGRKEFEMIINAGIVRECEIVEPLMEPHLEQLSEDPELRARVSKETIVYWEIMRVCQIISQGAQRGDLMEDLYKELQKRHKNNPDKMKSILAAILHPFQNNHNTKREGEQLEAPEEKVKQD